MIKAELEYIIPEPPRYDDDRSTISKEILKHLFDNAVIDRKFNNYLKGKSVVVVGPAPYVLNQDRVDFINSHDVVVRINKSWPVTEEQSKHIGSRTDIRWHCGMEHTNNGGPFMIEEMMKDKVEWLCINFPKHLDYFHNDIKKFEELNKNYNMNFHCWSDLELYISLHTYLGTRMNAGTAAITDLLFYDIKSLHVMGVTFFDGGWYKGYKEEGYKLTSDNHAMIPQKKLVKLLVEMDKRLTLDDEVKQAIGDI